MLLPETYPAALCLAVLTILCRRSWANTLKLCPGYCFQIVYRDCTIGLADLGAVALAPLYSAQATASSDMASHPEF